MSDRETLQRDVILLIVLCAVVYLPFLHGPFVYDDVALIAENPQIRSVGEIGKFFTPHYWNDVHVGTKGVFRPLREVVFTLVVGTVGAEPAAFHMLSLALHIAATLLVYALGRRVLQNDLAVRMGAALFAVHPIHMEAVLWAKNLAELMAAVFVLTAFLAFLNALDSRQAARRAAWAVGATALYALALLCKESGLALPLVLLVYALFAAPTEKRRRAIALAAPLLVLFAGYVVYQFAASRLVGAALHGMRADPDEALWLRPALVCKTYAAYGLLLLFPAQLCMQYHFAFPIGYTGYEVRWFLLFFVAVAVALGWAFLRNRRLGWVIFWPVLFLGPASNVIPFKGRPIGDQRLYVPSIGFCLLAGLIAAAVWRAATNERRRRVARVGLGAAFALMLVLAWMRGPVWINPAHFWFDTLRKSPLQSQAHFSVARSYWRAKMPWPTLVHAHYATQGDPLHGSSYALLGEASAAIGDRGEAARAAHLAGLARTAGAALFSGRYEQAVAALEQMVALIPDHAGLLRSLGEAYRGAGLHEKADAAYRRADELDRAP